jgi:hypothetical protein
MIERKHLLVKVVIEKLPILQNPFSEHTELRWHPSLRQYEASQSEQKPRVIDSILQN